MTTRRPQDPMTKKIRDEEDHIATLNPYAKRAGGAADDDPAATTLPEDFEPAATVMPDDLEMPAPKANRAAQPPGPPARTGDKSGVRSPSPTFSGDPATRQAVRNLAAGSIEPPTARSIAPRGPRDGEELPTAAPRVVRNTQTVLRPRTAAKRGSSWVVWVLAFLVLAGIGFGVSWFILNPAGGGTADPGSAAASPSDKPPEAVAAVAAAPTDDDASSDTTAAAPPELEADPAPTPDVIAAGGEAPTPDAIVAVAEAAADSASAGLTADTTSAESDTALAVADVGPAVEPDATAVVAALPAADAATPDAASNAATGADASGEPSPTPVEPAVSAKVAAKPKNPAEATRLNEAGLKARKAGDHDKALAFYADALTHNPDNVWARYNYACELALLGRGRDALVELTTLYKMDTADARKALAAARKDSDFASIRDSGQFFRLTNF
jgi:hypothetical protein